MKNISYKSWYEQLTLDNGTVIDNIYNLKGYGLFLGYYILEEKKNELIKKSLKINSDIDVYYTMSCRGYKKFVKNDIDYKMFKISLYLAKLHYKNVYLITDNLGADILKNLPFTDINCCLEEKVPAYLNEAWSLPKIFTYQIAAQKNKPFIHIDNDVFLFGAIPENKLNHPIIAEHNELDNHWYNIERFINNLNNKHFYKNFSEHKVDSSANVSVFGGTDLEFINFYCEQVINMCLDKKNKQFLSQPEFFIADCIEQYSLSFLAKKYNKKINFLVEHLDQFGKLNNMYKDSFDQRRWHLAHTKYAPIGEQIIDKLLNMFNL